MDRGRLREEWTFFVAWKQAFGDGTLPYHLGTAMQGTERYLANLQTPMMPYVAGLALVSVKTFVLFHIVVVYIAGFLGAIALRRELALGLLPWMMFVLSSRSTGTSSRTCPSATCRGSRTS